VLAVVYLIFNEGLSAPCTRGELAAEAIRLGCALTELMPDEPEAQGLVAMMLLLDGRRKRAFGITTWSCSPTRTARSGT